MEKQAKKGAIVVCRFLAIECVNVFSMTKKYCSKITTKMLVKSVAKEQTRLHVWMSNVLRWNIYNRMLFSFHRSLIRKTIEINLDNFIHIFFSFFLTFFDSGSVKLSSVVTRICVQFSLLLSSVIIISNVRFFAFFSSLFSLFYSRSWGGGDSNMCYYQR